MGNGSAIHGSKTEFEEKRGIVFLNPKTNCLFFYQKNFSILIFIVFFPRSTKENKTNNEKTEKVVHEKEKRQCMNSTSVKDLWTLYKFIRYYKTNNNTSLAEPFLDLPLKKELPDYYLLISKPISLSIIR